ncbi:MAG: hypothetical protein RTV31_17030 [Candidatus Thorarchaeota archaeon]
MEAAERDAEYFESWGTRYITYMGTYPLRTLIIGTVVPSILLVLPLLGILSLVIGQIPLVIGGICLGLLVLFFSLYSMISNPPTTLEDEFEYLYDE